LELFKLEKSFSQNINKVADEIKKIKYRTGDVFMSEIFA